jgi:hypothetical protein
MNESASVRPLVSTVASFRASWLPSDLMLPDTPSSAAGVVLVVHGGGGHGAVGQVVFPVSMLFPFCRRVSNRKRAERERA